MAANGRQQLHMLQYDGTGNTACAVVKAQTVPVSSGFLGQPRGGERSAILPLARATFYHAKPPTPPPARTLGSSP